MRLWSLTLEPGGNIQQQLVAIGDVQEDLAERPDAGCGPPGIFLFGDSLGERDHLLFHRREGKEQIGRRSRGRRRVFHTQQFDIEDQFGLGRDGAASLLAISELVRNKEAAFAADFHAFEAHVPARDHLPPPLHKRERVAAVHRGIELGAVAQPSGVVDGELFAGRRGRAVTGFNVDVAQGRGLGDMARNGGHGVRHFGVEGLGAKARRKGEKQGETHKTL